MRLRTRLGALGLSLAAASIVAAMPIRQAAAQADEGLLETRIREIALAVGNTYVCIDGDEARTAFRDQAQQLFDLVMQDVGSNRAFLYAVSVGYGASVPKAKLDCAKLESQWRTLRTTFALEEPGP